MSGGSLCLLEKKHFYTWCAGLIVHALLTIHVHFQISLRFLGIILRVLRLEVSVYNVYITNQFKTTFAGRGGVESVSRGDHRDEIGEVYISALSAVAYTTTFYVMVNIVKGGARAPPTLTSLCVPLCVQCTLWK